MRNLLVVLVSVLFAFQVNGQQTEQKDKNENHQKGKSDISTMAEPIDPPPGGGNTYPWNRDMDGDGYGDPYNQVESETKPAGYVANNSDCDDTDPYTYPGAPERLDGKDNNCDGIIDNGTPPSIPSTPTITKYCGYTRLTRGTPPTGTTWYWQSSSSGTSTSNSSVSVDRTSGSVYYIRSRNNSTLFWSSARTVNYTIDVATIWYLDSDGDGFGDPAVSMSSCSQPTNYVANNTDNCPGEAGTNNGCPATTSNPGFSDENYVYTRVYKKPFTSPDDILSEEDVMESITYFDGLGRPLQTVGIRAGGNSEDVITHIGYDAFGRQEKDYLPYAAASYGGAIRTDALSATNGFYLTSKYENTTNPYSEKLFEASPLNRVLQQAAPGASWKLGTGHEIKFDYQTNVAGEVKLYTATAIWNATSGLYNTSLVNGAGTVFYGANLLYKTITYDENTAANPSETNGATVEFKNKQGQVVLKRTYNAVVKHDTYYVYDDYGNLTYVIPPKADIAITTAILNELCYQYKYDSRNRLAEKKVPGKGWEYIVYNKLDQPILTQDANLKTQSKWLFTKYDVFGRVAYTGLISSGGLRPTLQTAADAVISQFVIKNTSPTTIAGTTIYYNNGAYPILAGTDEIHTINYYDNYTFDKDVLTIPETSEGQAIINYNDLSQWLTKGLATGSKVRVLGTTNWITTITGYDAKGRPIYAASRNNYLSTTDVVTSLLDFIGKVDKTTTSHSKGTTSIITENLFTYDHTGRLKKQTQELNNTNVLEVIAENTYDELGQLTIKGVGGKTSRLQTINYAYNIRGWLKQINNPASLGTDLFGFKINYNTVSHGATALYNGNISETEWKTQNDNVLRWYKYGYDKLNRITSGLDNTADTRYSLTFVDYDKNGNIQHLNRRGQTNVGATTFGIMDQLTYTYQDNSNKLTIVSDAGNDTFGFKDDQIGTGTDITTDYTYDANGNMKTDANKGITAIAYNHLNLPTSVTLGGGTISYIYDATGVKQRKVAAGTTTEYAGNYLYQGGTLQFFNHPEGYVENDNGTFRYHYQYKDHLGNIRLSYTNSGSAGSPNVVISEENNYYPFGLRHKGYNDIGNGYGNSAAKKYKFGGKELQEEHNLEWYDVSARNYDPALGRWMNLDPLAEQMRRHSPYNYAYNNPLRFVDPTGMAPEDIIFLDTDGNEMDRIAFGGDDIYLQETYEGGIQSGINVGTYERMDKPASGSQFDLGTNFSGSGFGLNSNSLSNVGLGVSTLGAATAFAQEGLLSYRMSLATDLKIGSFSRFSTTYTGLGTTSKVLGGAGNIAGGLGWGSDLYDYSTDQMNGGRFAFRTTGFGLSLGSSALIGGAAGSGVGLLVGGGFMAGEMGYDSYKDRTWTQNSNKPVSIGSAIQNFFRMELDMNVRVWMQGLSRGF